MMTTMSQNLICISPSPLFHQRKNPICSISYNRDMNTVRATNIRATNIRAPLVLVAGNMGKTRSLCFPRADPNFVACSRIAGTAASATGSILMCGPEYVSAPARKNHPTYGFFRPRSRPSLYPVEHPVNMTPAHFAVNEFNKETNGKLHLETVVAAFEELKYGYFHQLLKLEALDEDVAKIYDVEVKSKSGTSNMRLVYFREDSTAVFHKGSTLMCGPENISARATENPPTYGFSPSPPLPSHYSVDHPVNTVPARFSVDEFNKETNSKLHLVRVVAALEQRKYGYLHRLLCLEVVDEGVAKIYEAEVKTKLGTCDYRLVYLREGTRIATIAASFTGSTSTFAPGYISTGATEKRPRFGFFRARPLPSPYPVDHHLNMAPARFAVDEFNKETNNKLHLVRVVAASELLACGRFIQHLRLEVLDEGVAKIYDAEVESRSGSSDMRLVNCKVISG